MKFFSHPWDWWLIMGLAAQLLFSLRFLIQWLASERRKASVVPLSFWYISLVGGILLLVYAIHRRDPVFILGQATGGFIYLRNIILIKRNGPREPVP